MRIKRYTIYNAVRIFYTHDFRLAHDGHNLNSRTITRQAMYVKRKIERFCATIFAVEKQKYYTF